MTDTLSLELMIVVPYRYNATAGALVTAIHAAQGATTAAERRQHVSVARIWYDSLSSNLRAITSEIAETQRWISDHAEHPLMPQMRTHLARLRSDANSLDRALTDLLLALSTAGEMDHD